ncbi:type II/IV secretion system ATPase subunit [Methanococcus voltae]|uniref:Flagellar protein FlaI n=2 Tax=Methanococcus voltae TaxID=2188 RepID=O06642_METVO|nr:type II/IV secretion system ATPase subunit [Methanococcus voltae]AAB57833.1 putative flagella-related protein I [Methanococcus voltae PS]MBP2172361.1 flagellar protein FlaI [Methanococcus voltae]MBP2200683.1 flagellar protein FlaI [Methanococcus voltae]MCS3921408.1 flagellar protein FlaI [Methanococcus voltae PS]
MADDFNTAQRKNPHLKRYVERFKKTYMKVPDYITDIGGLGDLKSIKYPNVIYPIGDPLFIHVYGSPNQRTRYIAIEPKLDTATERAKYFEILDKILEYAPYSEIPESDDEFSKVLIDIFDTVTKVNKNANNPNKKSKLGLMNKLTNSNSIAITKVQRDKFVYLLRRDLIGIGNLEPIKRDPTIEDIHVIGPKNTQLVHKTFDMLPTNIVWEDDGDMSNYLKNLCERMGRPVSDATPIVDGSMPDGSRINILYSNDVSLKGPSFTIRKFSDTPTSITQIISWGTMSPEIAAYLWLCLEYGMSIFVCGETASGKTTTLNAIMPFIKPKSKVFSCEDTAEVKPPNPVWQQLLTRERGPEESRVTLFDLLRAALRSRPNYIIVGEIRSVEGAVAFQAMQTGHPVLSTFHAANVRKMIQRLTGDPINIPQTFMDNLNIALFQLAVYTRGRFLRRVVAVEEIEGYYKEVDGVITRGVFEWDPQKDIHNFTGLNNSYILEDKIATVAGYEDPREIYDELNLRVRILEEMIAREIYDYHDVLDIIWKFYENGLEGLPFPI